MSKSLNDTNYLPGRIFPLFLWRLASLALLAAVEVVEAAEPFLVLFKEKYNHLKQLKTDVRNKHLQMKMKVNKKGKKKEFKIFSLVTE